MLLSLLIVIRDMPGPGGLKAFVMTIRSVSHGPRQANLVLIAYVSSEGSGELRIHTVSPEPSLLAHTSIESRGTFRQKARSIAPLSGWACAVEICHDRMLEDTNSLDRAHIYKYVAHHSVISSLKHPSRVKS